MPGRIIPKGEVPGYLRDQAEREQTEGKPKKATTREVVSQWITESSADKKDPRKAFADLFTSDSEKKK